jgi:hypothetical protein
VYPWHSTPHTFTTFTFTFNASCYLWFQLPFLLDTAVHKTVHLIRLHILKHRRAWICKSPGCHNVPTGKQSQTFRSSVVFRSSVSSNPWTVTKNFLQSVLSLMMQVSNGISPFHTHRPPTEMYNARLAEKSVNIHSSTRANQLRQPTQRIAFFHTRCSYFCLLHFVKMFYSQVTFPPLFYIRRRIRSRGYRCHKWSDIKFTPLILLHLSVKKC